MSDDADLELERTEWIQDMRRSGAGRDGILWPNLPESEQGWRKTVIREHFPELIPLIASVTADDAKAREVLSSGERSLLALHVQKMSQAFAYRSVAASVDLIDTADGLNFNDIAEASERLTAAIDRLITGSPSLTLSELFGWSYRPLSLRIGPTLAECQESLRQHEDGFSTLECGQLTGSWATPHEDFAAAAAEWGASAHWSLISNPMIGKELLTTVAKALVDAYPVDLWTELLAVNHAEGPDLEELEDGDQGIFDAYVAALDAPRTWALALENPLLSTGTLGSLWGKAVGHNLELPMLAGILLHPSCSSRHLQLTYDRAREHMDWPLICIAANPATPPGILASMATLDIDQPINIISELDVGVEDVLVAIALNPSTDQATCTALSQRNMPRITRALEARP